MAAHAAFESDNAFERWKAAFATVGLSVEDVVIKAGTSAVKLIHDEVPYVLDCREDFRLVAAQAARWHVLVERHHALIKRVHSEWGALLATEIFAFCSGAAQLQVIFATSENHLGVFCLSLSIDGRCAEVATALEAGRPYLPTKPRAIRTVGPFGLLAFEPWLSALPEMSDVQLRCMQTYELRQQPAVA